jgi:hypothetical protein
LVFGFDFIFLVLGEVGITRLKGPIPKTKDQKPKPIFVKSVEDKSGILFLEQEVAAWNEVSTETRRVNRA